MNIAIGKFGRTMKFDEKTWNIYAGDDSPKIIYFELAKRHPEHTFYIINNSDFTKFKKKNNGVEYIPENIIDLHEMAKTKYPYKYENRAIPESEIKYPWQPLDKYIEDINLHIDLGLFMQGMDFAMSIAGVGLKRKTGDDAKFLGCAEGYCSKMIYLINKYKFPWYNINEDPRYLPYSTMDILKDEEYIFSQINKDIEVKRIVGYDIDSMKFRDTTLHYKYSGIERMFLASKKKIDFTNPDDIGEKHLTKNNQFIMTLNEGPSRRAFIEKWILKYKPDMKIYGRWTDEKTLKAYPDTFIEKGIVDMEDEMWSTMFTFVPCFNKTITNFVTQKVWKMIYYGILPFWDKNAYDTDNIYKEIPDYFKVETPEEMWEKIDYLTTHKDEYVKYLKIFYNLLEDKYFNGDFIEETFGEILK